MSVRECDYVCLHAYLSISLIDSIVKAKLHTLYDYQSHNIYQFELCMCHILVLMKNHMSKIRQKQSS